MSDFVYSHIPGDGSTGVTLVLLHGTGGDEKDLLPLGRSLLPGATLLSPRGKVLEDGMPRYFRRLRENVFDLLDLRFRTNELADFLARFEGPLIAVGYSNGASIAASTLLLRPEIFAGAVLLRARVPIAPDVAPDLSGKSVLVSGGRRGRYARAKWSVRRQVGRMKPGGKRGRSQVQAWRCNAHDTGAQEKRQAVACLFSRNG